MHLCHRAAPQEVSLQAASPSEGKKPQLATHPGVPRFVRGDHVYQESL